MIGVAIYSLCALVSITCAVLLTRGYLANRTPLLFWSSLGFGFLAFALGRWLGLFPLFRFFLGGFGVRVRLAIFLPLVEV